MATARLISPELEEMLKLVGDADSVELKLTVPDEDRQSAAAALGVDPLNARIRQVYFFDTPTLRWTPPAWWCERGGPRGVRTTP